MNDDIIHPYVAPAEAHPAAIQLNHGPRKYVMQFHDPETGKSASIEISREAVTYRGDIPVDDAAQLFFKHVLQTWRHFDMENDYHLALIAACEAGHENCKPADVIKDQDEEIRSMRLMLETISYECKDLPPSDRKDRIWRYVNRALGIA